MKRRYTILFLVALCPLFGDWMGAKQYGFSIWDQPRFRIYSMIVTVAVAAISGIRNTKARWPAWIAAMASLPYVRDVVGMRNDIGPPWGVWTYLFVVGALATFIVALAVACLPVPGGSQVPPARVVD